ncbi:hypothetical protein X975_25120, partial [Stegodyphus mimosarum]
MHCFSCFFNYFFYLIAKSVHYLYWLLTKLPHQTVYQHSVLLVNLELNHQYPYDHHQGPNLFEDLSLNHYFGDHPHHPYC